MFGGCHNAEGREDYADWYEVLNKPSISHNNSLGRESRSRNLAPQHLVAASEPNAFQCLRFHLLRRFLDDLLPLYVHCDSLSKCSMFVLRAKSWFVLLLFSPALGMLPFFVEPVTADGEW